MQPYFSVILPIYNVEQYLPRCVDSILSQSFADYELILVDDGSPDGCPQLCDRLAAKDARIRVIHKENGGLSSARNAGMAAAQGKYIWWVDSDDWIESGALQRLYDETHETFPDVVKFSHYRSGAEITQVKSCVQPGLYEGAQLEALLDAAFASAGRFGLSAWTYAYRRDAVSQIRFVSERQVGSEDYLFNLMLLPCIQKMLVLPDALYYYDLRDGSLTQRYRSSLAEQYASLCRQLTDFYKSIGKDSLIAQVSRFYIWHLMMGTCIQHEYSKINESHSMKDARRNVRALLGDGYFRKALRRSDKANLPLKKRAYLAAMGLRMECVFYWIYVVSPERKKRG